MRRPRPPGRPRDGQQPVRIGAGRHLQRRGFPVGPPGRAPRPDELFTGLGVTAKQHPFQHHRVDLPAMLRVDQRFCPGPDPTPGQLGRIGVVRTGTGVVLQLWDRFLFSGTALLGASTEVVHDVTGRATGRAGPAAERGDRDMHQRRSRPQPSRRGSSTNTDPSTPA